MALTFEQRDVFKASFKAQLSDFIERRKADIGGVQDWKPRMVHHHNQLSFRHTGDKKDISFIVRDVPDSRSPEDALEIRQAIYDICTEAGFIRNTPRKPSSPDGRRLARGTYARMHAGDEEAWQQFVSARDVALHAHAKQLLGTRNRSILEADDLVGMGYLGLLQTMRNAKAGSGFNPDAQLYNAVFRAADKTGRIKRLRRSMPLPPETARDEEAPASDTRKLARQLADILEEARGRMTRNEKSALDMVLAAHAEGKPPLKVKQIGLALGYHGYESTTTHGSRILRSVTSKIQETAQEMGPEYAETSQLIDRLVHANEGRAVR